MRHAALRSPTNSASMIRSGSCSRPRRGTADLELLSVERCEGVERGIFLSPLPSHLAPRRRDLTDWILLARPRGSQLQDRAPTNMSGHRC